MAPCRRNNEARGSSLAIILTSIGIAREVASPLNVGATLSLAGGHGIEADGGEDGRVAQLRLGGDDAVGDVMVDGLIVVLVESPHCVKDRHELFQQFPKKPLQSRNHSRCAPPA